MVFPQKYPSECHVCQMRMAQINIWLGFNVIIKSNIEEPQYDLRSRDTLRPPTRYASLDQMQIQGWRVED